MGSSLSEEHAILIVDAGWYEGSNLDRLSENAKFKKSGVDIKGLMTREFSKIPILGQPVD